MPCCTLLRHLLSPAAWLQTYDDSRAAFSHLLRVSYEMVHEAGAGVASPDNLAILLYTLVVGSAAKMADRASPVRSELNSG